VETVKCIRRKRRMRGGGKQGKSPPPAPSRHCERRMSRTEE